MPGEFEQRWARVWDSYGADILEIDVAHENAVSDILAARSRGDAIAAALDLISVSLHADALVYLWRADRALRDDAAARLGPYEPQGGRTVPPAGQRYAIERFAEDLDAWADLGSVILGAATDLRRLGPMLAAIHGGWPLDSTG
jgi:hypothetical protein